ncbi:MAG: MFS transporter, partial [Raoultibacter sp.]
MAPNTTIIRFLASDGLSLLGNSVAGVALPLILLAVTGDPLAAGTLALICALPQVLAGVLGGALLDRFNRRSISIISDLISATAVAALPLIDMTIGLSFGWFVLFGVLGAIGDIPGMTARDTLLPAGAARDNVGLQQFMGIAQSLASLVTIIGPALAAFLMGVIGIAPCLWITAALSLCAALVTMTLPRSIGAITKQENMSAHKQTQGVMSETLTSLKAGLRVLFKTDGVLTASFFFSLAIVMILGSFQGLILPVFFTYAESPELL